MADVFICYHHSASAEGIVRQIASELKKRGISSWYAEPELYTGDSVGQITRAIRECKVFLLILNQDALKSRYVENEVALAHRRVMNHEKMTLLPFLADNCDLAENPHFRYFLSHIPIANGNLTDKTRIAKLAQRVSRLTGHDETVAEWRPPKQAAPRPAENL